MASSDKITEAGDEIADAVSSAGRTAESAARRAGATLEHEAAEGADRFRRAGRRGARAYDEALEDFEGRADSLEATIRRNPLAAAGAALLVGIVFGRFIL
ncbi:MAG: hypothetical protein DI565_07960 [Ancylobacter novellus]|uniref:DUF883 domain-containing protein n=1 Tax=Ancylobacter novellus TaxID=921 RepID=A0A2W5KFJ4_ANCNO|nr:MAG: hypothetical protein DI565_07960 [Ancylobacter novellus]